MKTYQDDYVLSEQILKIILDMLFSFQNLFKYLISYNLPEDIPLYFLYQNLPENVFNSKHLKNIFVQLKDLCIKHLYSLYEYIEFMLFPFFLNQVNSCYSEKISEFTVEHLKMLFNNDEFKLKILIKKNMLIDAIRKFICRYLVSSDKSEVIDENENLILLLSDYELYNFSSPEDEAFLKIKDSLANINNLLVEPILVKNTLNLFDVLLEINPTDNNERSKMALNQYQNWNIINNNDISNKFLSQAFEIITEKKIFSKKVESIIEYIKKPERIIEFKELKQIGLTGHPKGDHTLYSLCKFEKDKIITVYRSNLIRVFSYNQETFRKNPNFKEIEIKGLREIKDTDHVNCVKILHDNSIILCCTKPKKIRLTIIKNEAKEIQILDGTNYNCQQFYNAIEFDSNKLITSTNSNIIIWEKNSDNNYVYKKEISTGSDTNLVNINLDLFASHVNDNTIRFYDKNLNESGSRISNITSRIEPLMMAMLNEDILGVCGKGNSIIYLVDVKNRKISKEVKFEQYTSDFFSISVLLDSSIIINYSGSKCIHAKLEKEGENYNLKIINSELGNLCADTFTFEYLFDEIFIHSCCWGDIHGYINPNINEFLDDISEGDKIESENMEDSNDGDSEIEPEND